MNTYMIIYGEKHKLKVVAIQATTIVDVLYDLQKKNFIELNLVRQITVIS